MVMWKRMRMGMMKVGEKAKERRREEGMVGRGRGEGVKLEEFGFVKKKDVRRRLNRYVLLLPPVSFSPNFLVIYHLSPLHLSFTAHGNSSSHALFLCSRHPHITPTEFLLPYNRKKRSKRTTTSRTSNDAISSVGSKVAGGTLVIGIC
jgi:hypothetical protein